MRIAQFFGKGRRSQETPRVEDEPPGRRNSGPVAGKTPPAGTGTPGPRIEATDAPASLARAGSDGAAAVAGPIAAEDSGAVAVAVAVSPEPVPGPSYEEIAARAYVLWLSQGRPDGRERENWIEAEEQLRAERAIGS
jgi:hypothetical protein